MIIGFHSIWPYENESFFTADSSHLHFGDQLWLPLYRLYQYGQQHNVQFGNVSQFRMEDINIFVFHEIPDDQDMYYNYAIEANRPIYLYNYEPEVVYPRSHEKERHTIFKKIFTQHDQYFKGEDADKYIKINPFCWDVGEALTNTNKENLCTIISSNRTFVHPQELYSSRVETINWFEKHHPDQFDLYGHFWDPTLHPSYKGSVKHKVDTLSKYKFCICYENSRDVDGYITEKIFDCFRAECVPVYWGAPSVAAYIPSDCYIDRQKFASHEELYTFISQMSDATYNGYLQAIQSFFRSEGAKQFTVNHFVSTMWNGLIDK